MRKVLNTIWTRAENGQNPSQKTLSRYLWNPKPRTAKHKPEASNSKTRCKTVAKSGHRTPFPKASNSKTRSGLGALDAKSPKHHLDTSRKRPKPEPKNSFTLPLESTSLPKASNSKTRSGLGALDAKSPKHHLDTSRKRPKPEPKNSLTLQLWNPQKQSFGPREIWPWNTASESLEQQNTSPKTANSKTQAVALEAKSPKLHLDTSRKRPKPDQKNLARYLWNPKKILLGRKSTCPVAEKRKQHCPIDQKRLNPTKKAIGYFLTNS